LKPLEQSGRPRATRGLGSRYKGHAVRKNSGVQQHNDPAADGSEGSTGCASTGCRPAPSSRISATMSEVRFILTSARRRGAAASVCMRIDETQELGLHGSETGQPRVAAVEQGNWIQTSRRAAKQGRAGRSLEVRSGRRGAEGDSVRCSYDHVVLRTNAGGARKW
jgi:hypothetical protein